MPTKSKLHPKMTGKVLAKFRGLTIYGKLQKAKSTGKDRVLIQIRQAEPKQYRVASSLSYMRSVDIQFEKDRE